MMRIRKETALPFLCGLLGLAAVLAAALWVGAQTGTDFLAHSNYDSFTLQAMTWREGQIALSENYPWLELAFYNGAYYVSFPPVPIIPMWLLSFAFGAETPSALVTLVYLLCGYSAAFCLLRRYLPSGQAACFAAFMALGGSLLDIAVSGTGFGGGVWFMAQTLAFTLTMLAFLLLDGKKPLGWGIGLIAIALAVGCRPLNALYVPFLLFLLYRHVQQPSLWRSALKALPYIIVPALIAVAYGVYNYIRFANPLEFGHSYLPELTNSDGILLSFTKIWQNLGNILRPPEIQQGALRFPSISGFAVYLTNPLFLYAGARAIGKAIRRELHTTDILLIITTLLHTACLLTHRTNGGWQYGTRYLTDAVPALVLIFAHGKKPLRMWEAVPMGMFVAFNVYGTVLFHYL